MAARDPRDVAIDALVQTRVSLTRALADVNARLGDLKAGDKPPSHKKHACPHPVCGIRFAREDQVRDHVELVHEGRV